MARIVKSNSELMVNKTMITIHIVAYLFIIVVNALQYVPYSSIRSYEIAKICDLVVYFVCTLIFGMIVNSIVTKIQAIN